MIELIAGIGVGLLAGSGGSQQIDTRSAIREQAWATERAGKDISEALDRHGVSTEATGHRETVRYVETVVCDRHGNILDFHGLLKFMKMSMEYNDGLRREIEMIMPYDEIGPFDILKRRGYLYEFEVHHFWNVVVGLKSYRHSYRCLPDGMAREIYNNPANWR